jgi:hypothetical protein
MQNSRLMFIATTFLSLYAVFFYKREGYLPGASRAPMNAQAIDPDKDAFSTAPHDDEYAPVQNIEDHDDLPGPLSHGGYGNSNAGASYDPPTSYGGAGVYIPPSVSEDTGYNSHPDTAYHSGDNGYSGENNGYIGATGRQSPVVGASGRVQFPTGRYDNV